MVCGEALPQSFLFRADNMPAFAQGLSDTLEEAKKDKVTLTLKRCRKCGLAQLDCSPVDYYRDVIVVSYNEVESNVELQSVGMVTA